MEVLKICAFAVVCAILSLLMRQYKPEFSLFLVIVCGVGLMLYAVGALQKIGEYITVMLESSKINPTYFAILLKAVAITYLCSFTADVCRDAGETAIASKVELAGKAAIILLALPIYRAVFDAVTGLLR